MLESLLNLETVRDRPWIAALWAIIISSIAFIFSTQVYSHMQVSGITVNLSGLFAVLFTVIPSVYFITLMIKRGEERDEKELAAHYEKGFWDRHGKDILVLLAYFFGITISFAIWTFALPADFFQVQLSTICRINPTSAACSSFGVTGGATGLASGSSAFLGYFSNNIQVMLFAFLFSIVFGAGAIFIIVWNASVLGVFIGSISKSVMEIPITGLPYLPHGIFEIAGYICAGIAGGILSAAIIRGHHKKGVFGKVFRDSIIILIVGIACIAIGAGIEAFL